MNNVNIPIRKLINDEKEPFGKNPVFDDVTFECIAIHETKLNRSKDFYCSRK
jgi:hypothetical protein